MGKRMTRRSVEVEETGINPTEGFSTEQVHGILLPVALCTLAFIACILFMVAPLSRLLPNPVSLSIAPGMWLARMSAWLPRNLGLASDPLASRVNTNYVEFMILMVLAFTVYGLCIFLIQKRLGRVSEARQERQAKQAHRLIWIGAIVAGIIFVLTPGMLSGDIIVYTSYSRLMVVHQANPYFTPLAAFPQDPYVPLDYWAKTIAAYGPIWLAVCGFWGLWTPLLGSDPRGYVLAFRLFALAAHLLNTWLVIAILRERGCAPRMVTLGALLYAWNPLVLLESSLGGHNDVFMVTFILLGTWFATRAERKGRLTHWRGYLPALAGFTLAALIKFTTLPVVILFIILLIFRRLREPVSSSGSLKKALHNWRSALATGTMACAMSSAIALVCYGPFWLYHSIYDIANSFSSPPSALYAENSILRALAVWDHYYHISKLPAYTFGSVIMQTLMIHQTWNIIDSVVLVLFILIGAIQLWRRPTLSTFLLVALATLCILLLVTPWFFSWYIIWPVGLAAVSLPVRHSRMGSSLLAFTLAFSFSALLTYLFKDGYPPFGIWIGPIFLVTIVPPLCAFGVVWLRWRPAKPGKHEDKRTQGIL